LSKARRWFGKQVYEQFFSKVIEACHKAGLIEGDTVYLDATLVRANASLDFVGRTHKAFRYRGIRRAVMERQPGRR
ncbi:MAG: hypothetical protein H5U03_02680, partial [Clostridia bacterium]|nr:hypothetical protein [Clostridia bacterium]